MKLTSGSSHESRIHWVAEFLTSWRSRLLGYFGSCGVRDAADREDLFQELYLRCHRYAERICALPEPERLRFIWKMAFNLAMWWHRVNKVRPQTVELPPTKPIPDSRPNPEELLLHKEQGRAERAAELKTEAAARQVLQNLSDGRGKALAKVLTEVAEQFRCHSSVEVLHFLRRYLFSELRSKGRSNRAGCGREEDPKRKRISGAIVTRTRWSRQSLDNKCYWLRRRWAEATGHVVLPGGLVPRRA